MQKTSFFFFRTITRHLELCLPVRRSRKRKKKERRKYRETESLKKEQFRSEEGKKWKTVEEEKKKGNSRLKTLTRLSGSQIRHRTSPPACALASEALAKSLHHYMISDKTPNNNN